MNRIDLYNKSRMMGDYQVRFSRQWSGQAVRGWRGSSSGLLDPANVGGKLKEHPAKNKTRR
jgi:hypothetical protein